MLMHRAHLRACRSTAVLRISFCDLSNCGNLTYFDIAFYRSLLRRRAPFEHHSKEIPNISFTGRAPQTSAPWAPFCC